MNKVGQLKDQLEVEGEKRLLDQLQVSNERKIIIEKRKTRKKIVKK